MNTSARKLLLLLIPLTLSGCISDTASYMIDGDHNHAITLTRSQNGFWDDKLIVSVVAARQPDCMGGLELQGVPGGDPIVLHQAPGEYAEPIYILDAADHHYAISTDSCQVQKFATAPADLGPAIGSFKTVAGKFQYVAGKP